MTDISTDKAWYGAKLCINNAQELFTAADKLGKDSMFGLATSLLVLSSEESAKAFGLLINVNFDQNSSIELQKYFKSHKHKQDIASLFLALLSMTEELFEAINLEDSYLQENNIKLINELKEKVIKSQTDSENGLNLIVEWQSSADNIKKRGFYIDYTDDGWQTPKDISEDTYVRYRDIALKLLKTIKLTLDNSSLEEFKIVFNDLKAKVEKN